MANAPQCPSYDIFSPFSFSLRPSSALSFTIYSVLKEQRGRQWLSIGHLQLNQLGALQQSLKKRVNIHGRLPCKLIVTGFSHSPPTVQEENQRERLKNRKYNDD